LESLRLADLRPATRGVGCRCSLPVARLTMVLCRWDGFSIQDPGVGQRPFAAGVLGRTAAQRRAAAAKLALALASGVWRWPAWLLTSLSPTTRRALSGHGYGLDRTSLRFTCAYARSCRPVQAMAGPACCRRQRDAPNTTDVAAPQQLAGRRSCHCCHNHRQARLQGGARARSTRQALYLCTLLKRTTSIRASAGPQRPTHRPPLTTHHSPPTTHTTTHTSLPATHCPPLANACFFAPLHRQEPGCRQSCQSCLFACPAWSSDGSHGSLPYCSDCDARCPAAAQSPRRRLPPERPVLRTAVHHQMAHDACLLMSALVSVALSAHKPRTWPAETLHAHASHLLVPP
jgi:hypothetical protein